MKILRYIFLYMVFFVICLVFGALFLTGLPGFWQGVFGIIVPGILAASWHVGRLRFGPGANDSGSSDAS